MTYYNRHKRTVREEAKGELDFSESERVYGRSTYINRPSSYYRESNYAGDTDRRHPRTDDDRYRYDVGGKSYVHVRGGYGYRASGAGTRGRNQTSGDAPRIYSKEGLRETNVRRQGRERISYSHRGSYGTRGRMNSRGVTLNGKNATYRGTRVPPEQYYVRETIKEEPEPEPNKEEPETEEAIVCCCGCVEMVDSIYCSGMKMFRCRDADNEKSSP